MTLDKETRNRREGKGCYKALLACPSWCPAEPLPLGVTDARDWGQGGKYFAKSLKLISLGKELDLADLYTLPLTSWLV